MEKFTNKKFVFHETFMNINGKASGSGFIGVVLGLIAGVAFIATIVGYFYKMPNTVEVMGEILKLVAAATLLLGVRKVAGAVNKKTAADDEGITPTVQKTEPYPGNILETPDKG
jgi:ABC-type transport system involved in cytochrome c biogenesis permease subunit